MIKAAFFDFDNTLYSHSTKRIPPDALLALQSLKEAGIRTYLCTVRHPQELRALSLPPLPLSGYVVMDGQLCLDEDFCAFAGSPIPGEDRKALHAFFDEGRIALKLVGEKDSYCNVINGMVKEAQASIEMPLPPLGAWRENEEIYQVCLFGTEEETEEVLAAMPGCRMTRWHEVSVDLYSKEGGKVFGIRKVLEHLSLMPEEIIAFGDEKNDVGMLQFAGTGVAMGNGTEDAKAAADYVTAAVDDGGIAKALRHLGLI